MSIFSEGGCGRVVMWPTNTFGFFTSHLDDVRPDP